MDRFEETMRAMVEELKSERGFLSTSSLSTIYFGGGTPSLLTPQQVATFMDTIGGEYDVSGVEEVTLEANPDDLTLDYLRGLRGAGINRLSIGVQSFDDATLRFMNRRHTSAQAVEAIEMARRAGFDNIAIDLIFGVSGFSEESLADSLRRAIDLGVDHIAAYHLTIEEGTLFARRVARGEFREVSEGQSEREFEQVREALVGAGYEHYEISNYARSGYRSRHNSSYWMGEEYLGVGAGAHSFAGDIRRWGVNSLDEWLDGERYEVEHLSVADHRNEMIMTRLRCCEGLSLEGFEQKFGREERERVLRDALSSIKSGDLIEDGGFLKIPSRGMLKSDFVIEKLFYLNNI